MLQGAVRFIIYYIGLVRLDFQGRPTGLLRGGFNKRRKVALPILAGMPGVPDLTVVSRLPEIL